MKIEKLLYRCKVGNQQHVYRLTIVIEPSLESVDGQSALGLTSRRALEAAMRRELNEPEKLAAMLLQLSADMELVDAAEAAKDGA